MIVLTGKSCSGKDCVATELEKLGYERIITYTTRPMRPNEVNGVTYHFTTVEDFFVKYLNNFFLETRFYDVDNGIWFYGSSIESFRDADDKTFCILTPSAIKKLKENNIPYIAFYIDVSDYTIKLRQKERGDDTKEARRRFLADKTDFENIDLITDYCISNENTEPSETAKLIKLSYEHELINRRSQ
jgi:guanylate kinase